VIAPGATGAAEAVLADVAYDSWVADLTSVGPERDAALRRLHRLLLRAAHYQVARMRSMLGGMGPDRVDEIANQAADEAMVALLGKLSTFEGRSRFTTWAYKFAVLQAAVEVRRHAWANREIALDESYTAPAPDPSPSHLVEAADLISAVRAAMDDVLTPHQRSIATALLVDEVAIDVLAERLGTTRGALYKTLHDARVRLREHLTATGYLTPSAGGAL
jgi:RNA polymerase sigma-70 factor (ECF subfamily)